MGLRSRIPATGHSVRTECSVFLASRACASDETYEILEVLARRGFWRTGRGYCYSDRAQPITEPNGSFRRMGEPMSLLAPPAPPFPTLPKKRTLRIHRTAALIGRALPMGRLVLLCAVCGCSSVAPLAPPKSPAKVPLVENTRPPSSQLRERLLCIPLAPDSAARTGFERLVVVRESTHAASSSAGDRGLGADRPELEPEGRRNVELLNVLRALLDQKRPAGQAAGTDPARNPRRL